MENAPVEGMAVSRMSDALIVAVCIKLSLCVRTIGLELVEEAEFYNLPLLSELIQKSAIATKPR